MIPIKRMKLDPNKQVLIIVVVILLLSLVLRFWKLGQFNELVFDEVYYAKFSNNYLIGKEFFHSHPPLAQYIIAFGMWLGSFFPASPDNMNELTGSLRSTMSYRWLNALIGSFIPLIVGAIAYQLTHRKSYGIIAMLFSALDGLFLVESRYALNNIYLVIFGLLGQLLFLIYLNDKRQKFWKIALSGVFFGASISIKWNGLGFLIGMFTFLLVLTFKNNYLTPFSASKKTNFPNILKKNFEQIHQWRSIKRVKLGAFIIGILVIPIATYSLLWIPHLILNPQYNFWEVHQQMLSFHERVGGNNTATHPYCSPWYSWLFMWRPIAYYYDPQEVANQAKVIYDVHAMGNPILWWFSTLAMALMIAVLCQRLLLGEFRSYPLGYNTSVALYLVINYLANFLPWMLVSRCTFLYHYMGASVFSLLVLAWIVDHWISSSLNDYRWLGRMVIGLIIIAFIYWLPLYLGLPLSETAFRMRLIFPNWI